MDTLTKPQKNLHVYNMLVELVEAEEQCVVQIRASEEEVRLNTSSFRTIQCWRVRQAYETARIAHSSLSNVFVFQVKEILQQRIREEAASQQLSISVYDTERNEKAKLHRKELVGVVQLGFLLALETADRLHNEAFSPIPGRVMFTY